MDTPHIIVISLLLLNIFLVIGSIYLIRKHHLSTSVCEDITHKLSSDDKLKVLSMMVSNLGKGIEKLNNSVGYRV